MAKLWQFSQGHPKAAFSEKVQSWYQRKLFKNGPKSIPRLKGKTSTLAQMALSSNLFALIAQRLEKVLVQKEAPNIPQRPSYGNFGKVTQNPAFSQKVQRGDKGKLVKNRQKSSPRLKGPKALWRK